MDTMEKTRKKWIEEDGEEADDTDRMLQEAIQLAVEQGRGWAPGEKEEYKLWTMISSLQFLPTRWKN